MATLTDTRRHSAEEVEVQLRAGKRIGPVAVSIGLEPDERCLFAEECEWFHEPPQPHTTEPQPTDRGVLYITNRRVLFEGEHDSTSFTPDDLAAADDYKDGVRVRRKQGRSDFFTFRPSESRLLALLINALVDDRFERADVVAFVIRGFGGPTGPEEHDDVL